MQKIIAGSFIFSIIISINGGSISCYFINKTEEYKKYSIEFAEI